MDHRAKPTVRHSDHGRGCGWRSRGVGRCRTAFSGTLSFLEDHLLYNPPADYLGHTEGKIRIFDDQGGQRWVTVGIEVTDQNTAPVSQDSAVEIFGHRSKRFTLEVVDLEHNPLISSGLLCLNMAN